MVLKYRNKPCWVNGIKFASKVEARRHGELKLMERAGLIKDLKLQPRYKFTIGETHICDYVADFSYTLIQMGTCNQFIVEDVKSKVTMTPLYRLKKKLMKAVHGIEITEITS